MTEAAKDYFQDMDMGAGEEISDGGDYLGGSRTLETDVYPFTITEAFLGESKSGAKSMNFLLTTPDGQTMRQTVYMTCNKAKGCKTFFVKQKTGEKQSLPGFVLAKHVSMLCAGGKAVNQLAIETKTVMLYDYDQKKEVPTNVPMCVELVGKQILAAVLKRTVDKNKDSGTKDEKGQTIYIPTGETRDENEIIKVFRSKDRKTVTEILAKDDCPKAVFIDKWLEKWQGQTEDRTTKSNGNTGAPGNAGAGASTPAPEVGNLFND